MTFVKGPIAAVITDENGYRLSSTDPLPVSLGSAVISVNPAESGAVNFVTGQVSVTGSAGLIAAARATRRAILVTNTDAALNLFVGSASVTTATGQKVPPGQSITIPIIGAIYGIGSGSLTATFIEVYD